MDDFLNYIFVEKFYSCCRDGLDGGRDMRSCASLPFFAILLGFALATGGKNDYYLITVYCMCWSLAVAIVQPYKKKFMAISDMFIFTNASILSATICIYINDGVTSHFFQIALIVFEMLPVLWLVAFITFKTFKTKIKARTAQHVKGDTTMLQLSVNKLWQ